MSQQNVEIVRAAYAAWNAGDMDGLCELLDPGAIIVRGLEGWPEAEPNVGREAVMRAWKQLRETWDADTVEPISFVDAGDRVIVRLNWHGVGHGPDLNMEMTHIYTVRKGRIFLVEPFRDQAEALEAVGLPAQDVYADSS